MKYLALLLSLAFALSFSETQSQICTNRIVGGYIPDYRDVTTVDYSKLTHAYYCFIGATASGGITNQSSYTKSQLNTMVSMCNIAGTSKLICVGSAAPIATVAASPTLRTLFADTLRKYCQHYDLDGVDIDWESISNSTDSNSYTLLMGVLHDTLSKYSLKLSATVGFGNYWMQWYSNKAIQYADWMQVMVYDQTGTWSTSPFGNHSSFAHVQQAETYWVGRGFNRNFMVIGLPFYGYKFANTSGGYGSSTTYSTIVTQYPNMDTCSNQTPCTDYDLFNGPNLIRKKVNYAIAQGFKGVFVWELGQDAPGSNSLLTRIASEYSRACAGLPYTDICITDVEPCTTPVVVATYNADNSTWLYYDSPSGNLIIGNLQVQNSDIIICDIMGRVVYNGKLQTDNSGNAVAHINLSEGMYIVNLQSGQTVYRKRLVAK